MVRATPHSPRIAFACASHASSTGSALAVAAVTVVAYVPLGLVVGSAAAALVVAALALQAPGSGIFRSRPLRSVGRVSYPLYLLHPLAFGVVAVAMKPGSDAVELVYFSVGLGLSLVLAWLVHRVVERPLIAVGKRLASRTHRAPATPALATA